MELPQNNVFDKKQRRWQNLCFGRQTVSDVDWFRTSSGFGCLVVSGSGNTTASIDHPPQQYGQGSLIPSKSLCKQNEPVCEGCVCVNCNISNETVILKWTGPYFSTRAAFDNRMCLLSYL